MRLSTGLALVGVVMAMLFVACVPSQNPLYTDKDVVEKSEFVGTWKNDTAGSSLVVEKGAEKSYLLSFSPAGSQATTITLNVHLVKLDDKLFMDAVNKDAADEDPALKAAHYFSKVDLQQDSLAITTLNENWLKTAISEGKVKIANETKGEKTFLTAPTEELQKLVLEYAGDEGAFANAMSYERVK